MLPRLDVLRLEVYFSLRSLWRDKSFTLLALLLLGLGMGLVLAVFTLLWQAVYAQLPVHDPSRIFALKTDVNHLGREDSDSGARSFSLPAYRLMKGAGGVARGLFARHGEMINLESAGGTEHALADFVTSNFFAELGVRGFGSMSGAALEDGPAAVLSYSFWQQAYGGSAAALNGTLRVNGVPFRIAGVAAAGFNGLIAGRAPKIYVPVSSYQLVNPGWRSDEDWNVRWLNCFVRVPRQFPLQTAEAELGRAYRAASREELEQGPKATPDYLRELAQERFTLAPAARGVNDILTGWAEPLRVLQWMTLTVLGLTTLNLAGLMTLRTARLKRDMVTRFALGATRPAVARLPLLETISISAAGGLRALPVTYWGTRFLVHLAGMDGPGLMTAYYPRGWALLVHGAVVLATGLLIGLLPAWQSARGDLASALSATSLTHSSTSSAVFARRSLAAAQLALSLVLTVAAIFFAKSLYHLVTVPLGFNAQRLTVFSIDPKLAHSTSENATRLLASIAQELRKTPGVRAVTYETGGPFPQGADVAVLIPAPGSVAVRKSLSGRRSMVGPHYFSTLQIQLLAGRQFDERDRLHATNTIVVNETLARRLFGNTNVVGRSVTLFNGLDPDRAASIIGVAADHRQSWQSPGVPLLYTPAQQALRPAETTFYVRMAGSALPDQTIRRIVRQQAAGLSAFDVATMQTRMHHFAANDRAMAVLSAAFAALALLVSSIGTYGVISYGASMRRLEFGLRMAVGAMPVRILWLVAREAVLVLCAGVALALPLVYLAYRIIGNRLIGVSWDQPAVYLAAGSLLGACTLAAAFRPALRAMRMNVSSVLRHQ